MTTQVTVLALPRSAGPTCLLCPRSAGPACLLCPAPRGGRRCITKDAVAPSLAVRLGLYVLLPTSGPVAQLGARLNGIQEVTGSIPVRSTILRS